jgi:hypothetical protein
LILLFANSAKEATSVAITIIAPKVPVKIIRAELPLAEAITIAMIIAIEIIGAATKLIASERTA